MGRGRHIASQFQVNTPAESDTGMFGGNSNWRGPIWMPVNALLIRALRPTDITATALRLNVPPAHATE